MSQIAQYAPAALYCIDGLKFALCFQNDAKQNVLLTTLEYFLHNIFPWGVSTSQNKQQQLPQKIGSFLIRCSVSA